MRFCITNRAIALPLALVSGFSIGLTGMRALVQTGLRT